MRDHHLSHRGFADGRDGFEKRPGRERGGRGPRVFAPGDLKLLLLALIAEQPCHGYDLIRQVRALPAEAGGRVPAAAFTAYAGRDDSERALNAGYQLHLAKPVAPETLVAAVAQLATAERVN